MHAPSLTPAVFVACAFRDEAGAQSAIRALLASGIAPSQVGIGAAGAAKPAAAQLAVELGVRDDLDPEDPLAGAPGLASGPAGSASIDRGGVIGAVVGIVAGVLIGFVPTLNIVPVDPRYRVFATVLLCFIVGALAGATLGGALAPQRSTHAAFRIVDEIEHHGFAIVAVLDAESAPAAAEILNTGGGLHVMSVPSD
jgi:hypothetical protein